MSDRMISAATQQLVADDELIAAVERADGVCVNGQPDRWAVAEECCLSAERIDQRMRSLAERGHVEMHKSIRMGEAGAANSYEVITDSDDVDPHERQIPSTGSEGEYTEDDCRAAVREVDARLDEFSVRAYERERDAEHPSAWAVRRRLGNAEQIMDCLEGER